MDITPQDTTQQSISDDQELAKALAGVMPDAPEPEAVPQSDSIVPELNFEETPAPAPIVVPTPTDDTPSSDTPSETHPTEDAPAASPELESIKNTALQELRPLMDKVDLPAEEKFDTYLMLIRSTDDASLIGPAHAAAQGISDEKRRAEALLDIIKEIDYLSRGQHQPTV